MKLREKNQEVLQEIQRIIGQFGYISLIDIKELKGNSLLNDRKRTSQAAARHELEGISNPRNITTYNIYTILEKMEELGYVKQEFKGRIYFTEAGVKISKNSTRNTLFFIKAI